MALRSKPLGSDDLLIRLDGDGPAYRQIYRALRAMILSGELPTGSRLPAGHRQER
jgi:DNA-binding GntR family transcriptional regulator